MSILKNRYEVMALVEAKMCNPNGDPDMGNRPRVDFVTGKGYITDVAFKARMRAYVADAYAGVEGFDVHVKNGASLNRNIAAAVLEVNNVESMDKKDNKKSVEASQLMSEKYWDVRTFGAVLSTGLNAGQVRGAVQVAMASSVDAIDIEDITISRMAYAEGEFKTLNEYDKQDAEKDPDKKRTLGTKQFTPYGLYIMKMTVSANLAEKVGFTEEDLKILMESVMQMYDVESSASKMGMSVLSPLVVFKHVGHQLGTPEQNEREAKLGCAPAYKLFDLLEVIKKDGVASPRDYKDYDITLNLSKLPDGVECGLKKAAFSDVEWQTEKVDMLLM